MEAMETLATLPCKVHARRTSGGHAPYQGLRRNNVQRHEPIGMQCLPSHLRLQSRLTARRLPLSVKGGKELA